MTTSARVTVLAAVALATVACGADPGTEVVATSQATTLTTPATTATSARETTTMPEFAPDRAAVVDAAKADLARRRAIAPDDITVLSVKDVTWPDGSLGCPRPGMSYTQSLVEGYQILLVHDGRLHDYHGAGGGEPFLCASNEKDGGRGVVPSPRYDD